MSERRHRFLEEAIELAQASGCTREDARIIVDYVFDRPAGAQEQEVGGVMVTLAALCNALKLTMSDAGDKELARKLGEGSISDASKLQSRPVLLYPNKLKVVFMRRCPDHDIARDRAGSAG